LTLGVDGVPPPGFPLLLPLSPPPPQAPNTKALPSKTQASLSVPRRAELLLSFMVDHSDFIVGSKAGFVRCISKKRSELLENYAFMPCPHSFVTELAIPVKHH
jgi:hypothetical protein